MSFANAYRTVKPAVVAIASRYERDPTDFPLVFGTGFFVSEEGVVCTCRHIADAILAQPKPADSKGFPAVVLVFASTEVKSGRVFGYVSLEIESIGHAAVIGDKTGYLGPDPPDVSYLLVNAIGTPRVEISAEPLQEGEVVAFAGFPMGRKLLKAPGWLHQVSATLHSGVVGAVLPHQTAPIPHGFLVHANTQGGASGSPVFREDGTVVGMVYMGVPDVEEAKAPGGAVFRYEVPTSITGCMSREVLAQLVPLVEKEARASRKQSVPPSLDKWMEKFGEGNLKAGANIFEGMWPPKVRAHGDASSHPPPQPKPK